MITITPEIAKNILTFMQRADLKGSEVQAFNEITQVLAKGLTETSKPEIELDPV